MIIITFSFYIYEEKRTYDIQLISYSEFNQYDEDWVCSIILQVSFTNIL